MRLDPDRQRLRRTACFRVRLSLSLPVTLFLPGSRRNLARAGRAIKNRVGDAAFDRALNQITSCADGKIDPLLDISCRSIITVRTGAEAGVALAGFLTIALPDASAGALFQLAAAIGKRGSLTMAAVPSGLRRN